MSLSDQLWCPASAQVTVLQARGLRIKGKGGTNDAYAVMQVGKEKYQTSVVEKSVAPVWKEEATFDLPQQQQRGGGGGGTERSTLHVHVLHRALVGPDKLLGQAVINLLQLSEDRSRNKTEWFKLLDKTGKADKDRGEVLVDIQFMRNNMTASMFDLSAAGKSRSRLGKFKDKVRGKKKESDTVSTIVPSFTQVLTDSEEEGNGDAEAAAGKDEKKKKHKMKSLFSPKSNLQKNMSQSMSVLPGKNSPLSGSQSSGLNVDPSEGKKKFKFKIHKRSGSSDNKDSSSGLQKHGATEQSNMCINGSHIYCEEPPARTSRIGSNFSLASSGHGSMEDVPDSSPPSVDSLRGVRQYSPWTEEEEEMAEVENIKEDVEEERITLEEEEEERRRQEDAERLAEEKRQEQRTVEEEEKRQREEEVRIRIEEEKKQEERRRQEEEQRLAEEKRRLEEEERRRNEEEKLRKEEEERIQREEEERSRRVEEERARREEELERLAEEKRRLEEEEEEEERRIKEEEKRQREEEERIRMVKERAEEERRRQEEERKLAEEKMRLEEEERRMIEEEEVRRLEEQERKRIEEEERIRMAEERAKEERRRQEEERKLEEKMRLEEEERRVIEEEEVRRLEEQERKRIKERVRMEEEKAQEQQRREEEESIKRQEEERKLAEQKRRKEEERRQREEELKRQEEEDKLAEEKRLEEEERRRIQEEEVRKEEEEKRREEEERSRREEEELVRKLEEEREEKRRLEEQERKRMEQEERIKKEEEEKARREKEEYERLVEKMKLEEEERKRIEAEERIRKEEEERIKAEEDRRRRKEEERRQEEEREKLAEEKRIMEEQQRRIEEKKQREEEERIRKEEERRHQEEERKIIVEEERIRQEEEEKIRMERERRSREAKEDKNKTEEEEKARRLEKVIRNAEERKKRANKTKQEVAGTKVGSSAPVCSTNPFDEDFSNNPFDENPNSPDSTTVSSVQQRSQPAVSSAGSKTSSTDEKDFIGSQREKRPAPLPPGRNQAERQSQREQDGSTRHLVQVNKQSKDKDDKTVSAPPQRSVHMIAPLSRSPTDTKNPQSLAQNKGKRPAPSAPAEPKKASSSDGKTANTSSSEAKREPIAYGLNPFEDDEEENEPTARDTAGSIQGPPAVSQAADGDAAAQAKIKSSKKARAPLLPATTAVTSSTSISQNTEGGHDTGVTTQDDDLTHPLHPEEAPVQESQPAMAAAQEAGGKKEAPPVTSRRLQPVKPLNPLGQQPVSVAQGEMDNKSTGIHSEVQEKTKANDTELKGPYAQLTREELISLALKQDNQLSERDKKICELEQYIDNLLVRVMEESPTILMSMNSMKKTV